jgi:hypothetical protein
MTTTDDVEGTGTPNDPWQLTTPPASSEFEAYRDPDTDPPARVVQAGKTQLRPLPPVVHRGRVPSPRVRSDVRQPCALRA